MPDAIDQTITALHEAGASDEEITSLLKEKFGKKQEPAPAPGIVSRFVSGAWSNLNPIAMVKGAANAVMHPEDTYNALVDKSAENFTEAKKQYAASDYGHAAHHAIAAVLPPYNVVTHAGDEIRKGNVAGGMGEAVGAGLTAKAPGIVVEHGPAAASATMSAANKAAVAGADVLENNPAAAAAVGAGVGYMHGGIPGMVEGAMGGGMVPRVLKAVRKLAPAEEAPPTPPVSRLVKNPQPATNPIEAALNEARQTETPSAVSLPPEPTLPAGYEDDIARMAKKAETRTPLEARTTKQAEPVIVSPTDLPFKLNKVDVDRITALDKQMGAEQTARALRHDPRFAKMSADQRVDVIRKISQEMPNTLPGKATAAIDEKFAAVPQADRAAYVLSWKTVNPAVYKYLMTKMGGL